LTKRRVDLLLLDSDQTVTAESSPASDDITVIDHGGVAVDNGKIVQVGSSELLERKFSSNNIVRVPDRIILPGFVDPHSHLIFAGSRELEFQQRIGGAPYLEILGKGGGILETVSKTRQSTEEEIFGASRERAITMLESGTTTLEVKTGYGLRTDVEMKMLRVISRIQNTLPIRLVPTFLGAHTVPPDYTEEEYTRLVIEEMLPSVRNSRLAGFCDVFCERGAFSYANSRKILMAAARIGLRTKIHADQFSDSGGAKLANRISVTSADHLVYSPSGELFKMGLSGVTPVVLPGSSESLLSKTFAPVDQMLSHELPVALGSDFSPSNWLFGQLAVAAMAARKLRMRSEDIIRGITINAARALGLEKKLGSLQPGKHADIVTLKANNYKMVGYSYGEGLVDKVLIAGGLVVNNGRVTI
jgi:imidazolonepropionase